ncbi:hypothetical protein ONZ45_g12102 [Pleurotus djamor]|nr:hypothetical protein ONZ45_g12102 [Pleurotus djamor]
MGGRFLRRRRERGTQMQNAMNGNGDYDYKDPSERFVEPVPHSPVLPAQQEPPQLLRFSTRWKRQRQRQRQRQLRLEWQRGCVFGKWVWWDVWVCSLCVWMSITAPWLANNTTFLNNPSSDSFVDANNADDANGQPSEAEMAADEWENSPISFSLSSTGCMPDDFDINAVPPIGIGSSKFGGEHPFHLGAGAGAGVGGEHGERVVASGGGVGIRVEGRMGEVRQDEKVVVGAEVV